MQEFDVKSHMKVISGSTSEEKSFGLSLFFCVTAKFIFKNEQRVVFFILFSVQLKKSSFNCAQQF